MKTFIAALLIISSSAFAQSLDATDALLSVLRSGEYSGETTDGEACSISIQDRGNKVLITATAGDLRLSREIRRGTTYRWQPGQRYFLSSDFTRTDDARIENVFRTIAVEENTQYMVVANVFDSGDREHKEEKVECVVDL